MRIMKYLTMGILFIGITALLGCKKEDMSKYATKDDLNNYATNSDLNSNQAKVFNYNLTFSSGSTWKEYGGITGYTKGDVVLTYMLYEKLNEEQFWVTLPFKDDEYNINWFAEFSDQDGFMYIMAERPNGSSPFTSSYTRGFKSVLIKANGLKTHPYLDLSNYEEVTKAFNLE